MIASLFTFAVSNMELGFVTLGVGLAIWASVLKKRQRAWR